MSKKVEQDKLYVPSVTSPLSVMLKLVCVSGPVRGTDIGSGQCQQSICLLNNVLVYTRTVSSLRAVHLSGCCFFPFFFIYVSSLLIV